MIQMTAETATKGRVLSGLTMEDVEAQLGVRAEEYGDAKCERKRFELDRRAINYIRQHVKGIGERERLYHMYMDLRQ